MKSVLNFINYWYFRYLLVTELYMVEKWERVMIHFVFFMLLFILSIFNSKIVLSFVSYLTDVPGTTAMSCTEGECMS